MLEPCEGKLSRTVLRGESGSNTADLLDLDNTGHGLNGAPYDMKDVYEDMEACKKMVYELWKLLSEEDWEEYYED